MATTPMGFGKSKKGGFNLASKSPALTTYNDQTPLLRATRLPIPPELKLIKNEKQHEQLRSYMTKRLEQCSSMRSQLISRITDIDLQVAGFIKLTADDLKRDRDNKSGKAPKPTKHNLPLTYAQLDEAVTYLLSVFAPNGDLFEAVASKDKQQFAKALTSYLNKQGERVNYYQEFAKGLYNSLKYNLGGWWTTWEGFIGPVLQENATGNADITNGIVWEGNVIKSFDMYNFLWDVAVHPTDLPTRGEYFATVEQWTPFRVRKAEAEGKLFGCDRFIDQTAGGARYYVQPPSLRDYSGSSLTGPAGAVVDWNLYAGTSSQEVQPGIEILNYVGWIRESDFGISSDNSFKLYRIVLANGTYIAFYQELKAAHGMLPCAMSSPIVDDLGIEQRGYAEQLLPLQNFGSFLLNTHQEASRKKLYGVTIYNPNVVPLGDYDTEDLIGGRFPTKSVKNDQDIDKAFRHYTEAPDTQYLLTELARVMEIMQKILPTDMLRQVADLDRATSYQAAATVQAGNRRHYKNARLISSQALTPLKFQMIWNIYQSQQQIEYIDSEGARQVINPQDIRKSKVELEVGDGLKGMDRLMTVSTIMQILGILVQVPNINNEVNLVSIASYITQLLGDELDLNQFKYSPEEKQSLMNMQAQASAIASGNVPTGQAEGGASAPGQSSVPLQQV